MRIYSSAYRFGAVVLSVCLFAGCLGHVPTVPTPKGSGSGDPVPMDTGKQPVRFDVSVVDVIADTLETKSQFRSDSLSVTGYELEGIQLDCVSYADSVATKASPVTSVHDTFGAFAYVFDGSWRPGLFPNLLCNERYSKSSGEWAASKQYYWPGADTRKVRFYGYSPYVVPGLQVLTTADDTGAPLFTFTCPDGVDLQTDLLIGQGARDYAGSTNSAARIDFRHVLSALTFRMGDIATPGTLRSVTLHGIYTEADFDCETMGWINHRVAGDYTVNPGVTLSGAQGETVTEGENTLMLIPQTFPEGATLEIVFNYEGVDLHVTAPVGGRTLNMARTRVYELEIPTIGEHIDITGDSFDWTAAPNGASFSMKVGRSWTAVPSDPWITVNETSGERGVKTVTFSVTGNKEVGVPRTGTIKVLLNGSSVAGTVTVRQEGDVLVKTEYSAVTIDSYSYETQDAAVHMAVTPTLAYQQTQTDTYLSENIVHTTLTSGATLTFSFPAKTGFTLSSASTGAVDVAVNPQGAERSVSVKVNVAMNGKSKEATAVLKQSADAKTGGVTYAIADISASPSSIGAEGGSSTISGGAGTSTWDWISQTQTTESFTANRAVTSPASISGTTVSVPANTGGARSFTVTYSYPNAASKTCTISQNGDSISYYDAPKGLSISSGDIAASGGTVSTATISGTCSQVSHYVSGRTETIYPTYSTSWSAAVSGSHLGTTSTSRTRKGTLTLTYTANGVSSTTSCDIYQAANGVISTAYSIADISASPASIGAAGGSSTIGGGAGTITYTYTSGSNAYDSFTASKSVTSPASISGTTVSVPANTGGARSFTVTYSYSGAASKTCTISQSGDSVVDYHYNDHLIAYGTPSASIGGGISAGGGSATVSGSVTNTWQDQTKYASGRIVDNSSRGVTGSVTWDIVSNGNSRFGKSGWTLTHSSMGTSETTDYVTVRVYNADNTSYYKDASTSVTNSLGSTHYEESSSTSYSIVSYGTPSASIGGGLSAGGGSAAVSGSVTNTQRATTTTKWYQVYTSGSTTGWLSSSSSSDSSVAGSVSWDIISNGNGRFGKSGWTLTHSSMGTSETTDYVTVRVYNAGNTGYYADASKSVTNYKSASYSISTLSASPYQIGSGGGTVTLSGGDGIITYTYSSGAPPSYGSFTPSKSVDGGASISGSTVSIPANSSTSQKTYTVTYSYSYASCSVYIYQEGAPAVKTLTIDSFNDPFYGSYYEFYDTATPPYVSLMPGFVQCNPAPKKDITVVVQLKGTNYAIQNVNLTIPAGKTTYDSSVYVNVHSFGYSGLSGFSIISYTPKNDGETDIKSE